mmetsp:Transcript_22225/g.26686  ORF Transcript_22225/g.26686 Transcript_22225/m.26686 type:complete len:593 (-) Transcript_22225:161-1939(-)|eukprot:CAMPEP_0197852412 /NCGR_PEP_ID=MMETSP1438-20131217/20527_1 /TAXON_ID=1461541 /ORGANISM="Pterosperma sp., Strain CCMP1384" /LENGTH=592 /DNA_ID=CAMNT_0043466463 /DNA_START=115 /DNA_END=1893 /DNA_ORIENTATION=-
MSDPCAVTVKDTKPYEGQKPGTSGLRKKTKVFMQENFLENFVQSTFDALIDQKAPVSGGTLVVSGDGRYYNDTAIQTIIKMAVANGCSSIWVGKGGLLSTPAVSAVIRERGAGFVPFGGFILTASHNPGGIDEDFGIKYNCENGGPAPEKLTNAIFKNTTEIKQYKLAADFPAIDINTTGVTSVGSVVVEVFDCTEDHAKLLLETCFDKEALKALIARKDFSMIYDSMNGVNGPYAKKILVDELGASMDSIMNYIPKEDFGGPNSPAHGHADPNLKNAREVCDIMGVNVDGTAMTTESTPVFGAAADGDGDRNMILGSKFFCTPSDSLAIITDYASKGAIPYFKDGVKGVARSMPTSCALDRVATAKNIPCFEVPTGWKFFGNLMDSKAIYGKADYTPFICGEESFGTGSNHVREKDGMWAVLAWLSILAFKNPDPAAPLVGLGDIVTSFWQEYGRNYYVRYDYEGVDKAQAEAMMKRMADGTAISEAGGGEMGGYTLDKWDEFEYTDPVDDSISSHQGLRFIFTDGSRIVFRLSGTGVVGATIRLYLEKYEPPSGDLTAHAQDVVKGLADLALKISDLEKMTGRTSPTVIT